MKKLALLVSVLLIAGPALVAQASEKSTAKSATKTHIVQAEVVSADAAAKTLTIKVENENKTVKVDTAAAAHLKDLKSGEKVKLTCRDNDKGEHEAVTHIQVEKTPK